MYSIYLKLKVTFNKYIKQIYFNALNSNKLRNSDHFCLVYIVRYQTSVVAPVFRHWLGKVSMNYHMGNTKAAFYNKRMSQFVPTGDHIIIEATMILFTDGNNCRCPANNDIMPNKSHIQDLSLIHISEPTRPY